ncbi:MAG: hypothetical protein WBA48_18385 [Xanthobacteraceae bacterium]
MNKKTFTAALIAALVVTGCARREEEPETPATETPAPTSEAEAEKLVPKATIAPVNVQVTLSPQAEAALKAKSEKVLVVATYSGDPSASEQAQKMADASGMIKLGENKQTLDGAGSITFQDDVIDKSRLEFIVGEVQLTVNVTSSKTSTPDNLLACPFYWKTLAEASQEKVLITCKALSEVQQ